MEWLVVSPILSPLIRIDLERSEEIWEDQEFIVVVAVVVVVVVVAVVVVSAVVVACRGRDPPSLYISTPDRPPLRLLC